MKDEFLIRKCLKCNKKINDLDPVCPYCNSPNKSIQIDKESDNSYEEPYWKKGWKDKTTFEKIFSIAIPVVLAIIFILIPRFKSVNQISSSPTTYIDKCRCVCDEEYMLSNNLECGKDISNRMGDDCGYELIELGETSDLNVLSENCFNKFWDIYGDCSDHCSK